MNDTNKQNLYNFNSLGDYNFAVLLLVDLLIIQKINHPDPF